LAFTATYTGPDDGLDQVDANLTLAGTVDGISASSTTVDGTWTVLPSGECPAASAVADPADGGIGGGGVFQTSPDSPTGYLAYFDFGVWSDALSAPPCSGYQEYFVAHLSGYLPFVPGSAQSTWPSVGGGTFTFDWTY
jgi:hypothetical protein